MGQLQHREDAGDANGFPALNALVEITGVAICIQLELDVYFLRCGFPSVVGFQAPGFLPGRGWKSA